MKRCSSCPLDHQQEINRKHRHTIRKNRGILAQLPPCFTRRRVTVSCSAHPALLLFLAGYYILITDGFVVTALLPTNSSQQGTLVAEVNDSGRTVFRPRRKKRTGSRRSGTRCYYRAKPVRCCRGVTRRLLLAMYIKCSVRG